MAKFKIGDKVRVTTGKWEGYIGTVTQITEASEELDTEEWCMIHVPERGACEMDFKAEMLEYLEATLDDTCKQFFESLLPRTEGSEYIGEMATITKDRDEGICIRVNEEKTKLNIAYFKVYNNAKPSAATMVARLHFKDGGVEIHEHDLEGKKVWHIGAKEVKKIIKSLKKESKDHKGYTNWQFACYRWNYENDLIDEGMDVYFNGEYDNKLKDNPAYVPSNQVIPDTWSYQP